MVGLCDFRNGNKKFCSMNNPGKWIPDPVMRAKILWDCSSEVFNEVVRIVSYVLKHIRMKLELSLLNETLTECKDFFQLLFHSFSITFFSFSFWKLKHMFHDFHFALDKSALHAIVEKFCTTRFQKRWKPPILLCERVTFLWSFLILSQVIQSCPKNFGFL